LGAGVDVVFTMPRAHRFLRSLFAGAGVWGRRMLLASFSRSSRAVTDERPDGGREASVVAHHVILAKVAARFHRDKRDRQPTRIFQPVGLAEGDMHGLALAHQTGA
jgi:hypothetical protein